MKSEPRRSLTGGMTEAAAANGIVVCNPGPRPATAEYQIKSALKDVLVYRAKTKDAFLWDSFHRKTEAPNPQDGD